MKSERVEVEQSVAVHEDYQVSPADSTEQNVATQTREDQAERSVAIQITEENQVSLGDSTQENVSEEIAEENQVSLGDSSAQNCVIDVTEEDQVSSANSTKKNVATQTSEENPISSADSIRLKLESLPPSTTDRCTIYRVHEKFRKLNESAYTPQTVSIGPFHRGKESLAIKENDKLHYVKALLSRIATAGIDHVKEFEACLEEIEDVARKCYSEPINLSKGEFVEMMFIDGLFMIELFIRNVIPGRIPDDPIFGKILNLPSVVRDLVLLENQLPMVVFNCLLSVPALKEELMAELKKELMAELKKELMPELKEELMPELKEELKDFVFDREEELKDISLNILALKFFSYLMPRDEAYIKKLLSGCQGEHFLDLLGTTFHHLLPKHGNEDNTLGKSVPSVTELKRVGVKFRMSTTKNGSFLDIKFKDGVMEIPPIDIEDQTDALFRNCIVFEQYGDGKNSTYMTSYAHFMDSLINSEEDVGVLCKQGIITHRLGHNEDVAALFNNLCKEVTVANFCYSDLCKQVNTYYNTRWHAWKATLKRDYFNSPWAIVSLVGAITLIILTVTATLFAVLSFTIHKS